MTIDLSMHRVKFKYIILFFALFWGLYEAGCHIIYRDIEVVDYETLELKVTYSDNLITLQDVGVGFYSYMKELCQPESFTNTQASERCNTNLANNHKDCVAKTFTYMNISELNQSSLHNHFRSFKVCTKN